MTGISRRRFNAGLMATVGAGLVGVQGAFAQAYPTGEVHLVCAFGPGTSSDALVRFFGEKMRPSLGRAVIVENKVGAEGNIAAEYTARAKPDGLTILLAPASALAANQHILKQPTIDPVKDLQVVAVVNTTGIMIAVNAKAPYKSLPELTDAMKKKGDKATYGFAAGGVVTVVAALYKEKAGLDKAAEVTYRASQDTLGDLESGVLDWIIAPAAFILAQEAQGRMRALAVSTPERLPSVPQCPTMIEGGYAINVAAWYAGFVSSSTPRPIVEALGKILADLVARDDVKKYLTDTGTDPWYRTPDQGQALMAEEVKNWAEYVRVAKIEKK